MGRWVVQNIVARESSIKIRGRLKRSLEVESAFLQESKNAKIGRHGTKTSLLIKIFWRFASVFLDHIVSGPALTRGPGGEWETVP
jgi:hypothetical protein